MTERKAVFFDIDGTIWDRQNHIPESTAEAIRALRRNGHLAFLCSGRSRAYIRSPKLLEIGFDGIVSGCGTMIEYDGKTVFYRKLDNELVEHTIRTVRKYGFRPILEGKDYLYFDEEEFGGDSYGEKLKAEMEQDRRTISGEWGTWEISKLSCATDFADTQLCFDELKEYYDYIVHNSSVVEMVPKGYHKGTGILKVCELLGMDVSDTIAFGDSRNDLEMICTAGIGVVMGNGTDDVKSVADYVTDTLLQDGIWKACSQLGLI